jgi:CO/xanthine dehydrogenase FAD-binding subunit
LEPKNLKDACKLLAEYGEGAKMIAGGQSLGILLRQGLIDPDYVINLKNLHELDYIRYSKGTLTIGALTSHSSIKKSSIVKKRCPLLVEAEEHLAHTQIRNWGTIGGNLSHADPAADLAPPLICLGAKVKVASVKGERSIAIGDFFIDMFTTALAADEILIEIEVPDLPPHTGAAYRKETVIAGDYPLASVAAVITLDSKLKIVEEAKIALGGLGPTPFLAEEISRSMIGKKADDKLAAEAGAMAQQQVAPTGDVSASAEYKQELAGLLTRQMINLAIARVK